MSTIKRRLFIIDSSCTNNSTHNAIAMNSAVDYVGKHFHECFFIAPHNHSFLYKNIPYIKGFGSNFYIENNLLRFIYKKLHIDILRIIGFFDISKLFNKYNINQNDLLFLPSASYYCMIGVLDFIRLNKKRKNFPKIYFKFCNILDFKSLGNEFLQHNFKQIGKYIKEVTNICGEKKVIVATETDNYATFLSRYISVDSVNTMVCIKSENNVKSQKKYIDINQNNKLYNIFLPGMQIRNDKGFFRLLEIIKIFCKKYPKEFAQIRFLIQFPKTIIEYNRFNSYFWNLQNTSKILYLNESLTNEELQTYYNNVDLVLLPYEVRKDYNVKYDLNTYALKGSAVAMEVISYKIPSILPSDVACCSLTKRYNNAIVCDNNEHAFADAIYEVMNINKQIMQERLEKAKLLYERDLQTFIDKFFR